ncbi:MAG: hypothetical protein ABIT01_11370 [Thermoanaerobaculia bacterium]
MKFLLFLLPALLAGLIVFAITPLVRRFAWQIGAVDKPGTRKVHTVPTPRLGGLSVVLGVVAVALVACTGGGHGLRPIPLELWRGAMLGLIPIFFVSLWDDIKPVRSSYKFLAHTAGALVAVWSGIRLGSSVHLFGLEVTLGVLAVPISILWIVGVTNAFNLIDGLDGLSTGLALISAVSLAGVFVLTGRLEMASASLILAGALLGFLPYNLFPASIFLGDSGATAIGFFLSCLALRSGSTLTAGFAILVPVIILGLPVAETLISMARRAVRRLEKTESTGVFEADREHIHHRLMALGLNQRRSVFLLYGVGIACAAAGYLSILFSTRSAGLLLATLVVAGFIGISRLGYNEFALFRRGIVLRMYDAPVLNRALFAVFVDLAFVVIAIYLSIGLKFDDWSLTQNRVLARQLLSLVPLITVVVFWAFRLYLGAWRQASVEDMLGLSGAVLTASSIGYLVTQLLPVQRASLSLFVIYTMTMLVAVNGARFSYRILSTWSLRAISKTDQAVLIYGAGLSGSMALREVLANEAVKMRPVGFVDDDPELAGRHVNGYPVFGPLDDLHAFITMNQVKGVVVSSNKIPDERVEFARRICEESGSWLLQFRIDFRPLSG